MFKMYNTNAELLSMHQDLIVLLNAATDYDFGLPCRTTREHFTSLILNPDVYEL